MPLRPIFEYVTRRKISGSAMMMDAVPAIRLLGLKTCRKARLFVLAVLAVALAGMTVFLSA